MRKFCACDEGPKLARVRPYPTSRSRPTTDPCPAPPSPEGHAISKESLCPAGSATGRIRRPAACSGHTCPSLTYGLRPTSLDPSELSESNCRHCRVLIVVDGAAPGSSLQPGVPDVKGMIAYLFALVISTRALATSVSVT